MREWTEYVRPHLAALRLDPGREAEILDELSQHLDQRFKELCAEGVSEDEARRVAVDELGQPRALSELLQPLRQAHARSPVTLGAPARGFAGGFWWDLRVAFRSLRKAPGFAVTAVLTLALAIGANTAIFSVIRTVLIDALPFPESGRLVMIGVSAPGSELTGEAGAGADFYIEYRENAKALVDLGIYQELEGTARAGDHVERLVMAEGTPSVFSTLEVRPVIGRLPNEKDDTGDVVVLSHWLWLDWFGGDPAVLGRAFEILNAKRIVVGVMGPEFRFPSERTALWIHDVVKEPIRPTRDFDSNLVGRLAPGADHESLRAELATLARRLPGRFGGSPAYADIIEKHRPVVRSLEEHLVGNLKRPLWILMGTVGIVLLIACANVANLLMVRAESRRRDIAVRRALGARRGLLVRSQMAEAILLAAFGGIGGALVAWAALPLLVRAAPEGIPRLSFVGIDPFALLFTGGVAAIAALAFGLMPAMRLSDIDITSGLRNSPRVGLGPGHFTRDGLVVVQAASALVLLVGSGLLAQSFYKLRNVDPGFDTENIFTFQMAANFRNHRIADARGAAQFHYDFMDRLAALPGVQSVGVVNSLPLDEGAGRLRFATDRTQTAAGGYPLRMTIAGGDYFQTMGIRLLSGSYFGRNTQPADPISVIVGRSAAEQLWPGEDALGKRLRRADSKGDSGWMTVVGVVEDVMLEDFRQAAPDPLVYLPMVGHTPTSWIVGTPAYVVKTPHAETISTDIRELIRQFAPEAPMYRIFTMRGLAARTMARLSFTMLTLAVAAGLALVLGAVGLYGTLSYMVSQRTREIGIRMALGAQSVEVRRMIVKHGGRVTLIGVVIGVTVSLMLTRLLDRLLFGVAAIDMVTFVAMSAVMIGVALLASYIPAWRASSVDPIVSLRAE